MPTSFLSQLHVIMDLVIRTRPGSVLDVGVGFGKYGFLSREYLELWDGRKTYGDWKKRIDGIEVFEDYLTPVHDFIYDKIYVGDAREILPTLDRAYDLVLLIDILEHFDYTEGFKILEVCSKLGKNTIVSTPKDIQSGDESFGNPFQAHKSQWEKRHFAGFGRKFFVSGDDYLICYIGEDAARLRSYMRNSRIKRIFPFLAYPYRIVKRLLR